METEGMTFIFRADAEGTYSLRFNRHDFVRDYILNDYVKVIVEQPPPVTGSSWSNSQVGPDRVYAVPRWPLATDPEPSPVRAPAREGSPTAGRAAAEQNTTQEPNTNSAAQSPVTDGAPGAPLAGSANSAASASSAAPIASANSTNSAASPLPGETAKNNASAAEAIQAEDWLKKAREEYNAGRIKGALDALDQFMIIFPAGSDEAFWLYGQSLEANNDATRDIRLALDYYRRLTREFPQSSRYGEARQRIAYLERFYFSIQ
jgi:hypothetical protein